MIENRDTVFQIPISAFQLEISVFQLQISAFQLNTSIIQKFQIFVFIYLKRYDICT